MSVRLNTIKQRNEAGRYGMATNDMHYLLQVIGLLEQQLQAQLIAKLDPDNSTDENPDCYCATTIQDDQGITVISEYNPLCPTHGTEKDPEL